LANNDQTDQPTPHDETVAHGPLKPKTVAPGRPKTVAPKTKGKSAPAKPKTRGRPGTNSSKDSTVKRRPPKNISPGRLKRADGDESGEGDDAGADASSGRAKVRMGLAFKFCLPVGGILVIALAAYVLLAAQHTRKMLLNEILKNGASGVSMLAEAARPMLKANNAAMSGEAAEMMWPISLKLIEQQEFMNLAEIKLPAGTTPEEYLRERLTEKQLRKVCEDGSLLSHFIRYPNSNGEPFKNEILDAYILDTASGSENSSNTSAVFIAGAMPFKGKVKISNQNWLGNVSLDTISLNNQPISLTRSQIEVSAGILETDGKTHKILTFTVPVTSGRAELGKAVLAIDAQSVEDEVNGLNRMLYGIGIATLVIVIIICIIVASIVTQPVYALIKDMNIVADGDLTHATRAHSADEIGIIANEFNNMTRHLLIAHEREKEAERLENELNIAREIQMKLLPPKVPRVKGFDMHAVYKPAKEVGGDYYDFLPISGEHLGLIVADVSGKGIPGSMVMSTTRTILHFVALDNLSSADTLTKTNAIVAANIKRGMFVTAFYLVIDVRRRQMVCSSAGHNPMVIIHTDGTLDKINPSGIALGFDKGKVFQRTIKEEQIGLQSGDRIVLYTDGVVEAMNEYNEEYTDERFYEFVRRHNDLDSKEFVATLLADLERHKGNAEQHDDITIVTFRVM